MKVIFLSLCLARSIDDILRQLQSGHLRAAMTDARQRVVHRDESITQNVNVRQDTAFTALSTEVFESSVGSFIDRIFSDTRLMLPVYLY